METSKTIGKSSVKLQIKEEGRYKTGRSVIMHHCSGQGFNNKESEKKFDSQ